MDIVKTSKWSKMAFVGCLLSTIFLWGCVNSKGMDKQNSKNSSVKVIVTYSSDYCGGALPPEDLLEKKTKSRKYVNQKLHVFNNNKRQGESMSFQTNFDGVFYFEGPAGVYYIYLDDKMKLDPLKIENRACKNWLLKPYAQFEVNKEEETTNIHIHKQCNPCLPPKM
ncbi:hypothetical protein [Xanthovirga aplysinae]|uniref:hypothetical protein n=1 Tax=Xanthovirga aplysinae TaxID=2529853 RepID=UPI0012BD17D6|nr:hypothetical protein [Xanthovirga aplysinae]MTI31635.1 hypothetical protein [Xanthovirga aplysinae]